MIGNLIDLLITKTADGNIKWGAIPEKWGCEFGRTCSVQTRNHNLKLELYFTDKNNKIEKAVLLVYDLNNKLSHSTSDEHPNMKKLAKDINIIQLATRERVITEAFRSIKNMAPKDVIPALKPKVKSTPKPVSKPTKTKKVKEVKKAKWKRWLIEKIDKF